MLLKQTLFLEFGTGDPRTPRIFQSACIYVYVRICACMPLYDHVGMYGVCTCVCLCEFAYAYAYVYADVYEYVYVCLYAYVDVDMCIYIDAYMYM